jgi:hypothetical protein
VRCAVCGVLVRRAVCWRCVRCAVCGVRCVQLRCFDVCDQGGVPRVLVPRVCSRGCACACACACACVLARARVLVSVLVLLRLDGLGRRACQLGLSDGSLLVYSLELSAARPARLTLLFHLPTVLDPQPESEPEPGPPALDALAWRRLLQAPVAQAVLWPRSVSHAAAAAACSAAGPAPAAWLPLLVAARGEPAQRVVVPARARGRLGGVEWCLARADSVLLVLATGQVLLLDVRLEPDHAPGPQPDAHTQHGAQAAMR